MKTLKPPTIRDVALRAGVAESTVSRVLTGAATPIAISEDTRQRVLRSARELAYRAHPGARALRGKGTNLLGVIVRESDDPFFSQFIDALGNAAKAEGYELALGYAGNDPRLALALSETLDLRFCDGLLLLGDLRESPEDHSYLSQMGEQLPLILACRGSRQLVGANPSVDINNRQGAMLALDHLARLGHRRIAFIGAARLGDLLERGDAYSEFMAGRKDGGAPNEYFQLGDNSLEGGYRLMARLLALPVPPSAVFAADDMMAIGALKAAAVGGWAVPGDLSVVGFDDIKVAAYLNPSLTTVHQPIDELACKSIELLLAFIRTKAAPEPTPHLILEPSLVVRESSAAPRS